VYALFIGHPGMTAMMHRHLIFLVLLSVGVLAAGHLGLAQPESASDGVQIPSYFAKQSPSFKLATLKLGTKLNVAISEIYMNDLKGQGWKIDNELNQTNAKLDQAQNERHKILSSAGGLWRTFEAGNLEIREALRKIDSGVQAAQRDIARLRSARLEIENRTRRLNNLIAVAVEIENFIAALDAKISGLDDRASSSVEREALYKAYIDGLSEPEKTALVQAIDRRLSALFLASQQASDLLQVSPSLNTVAIIKKDFSRDGAGEFQVLDLNKFSLFSGGDQELRTVASEVNRMLRSGL
jgi:hypothetical protein